MYLFIVVIGNSIIYRYLFRLILVARRVLFGLLKDVDRIRHAASRGVCSKILEHKHL